MKLGLVLVDENLRFGVSPTDVESNLYWWLSFFRDWFDNVYLLVHGDYMLQHDEVINMMLDDGMTRLRTWVQLSFTVQLQANKTH
jgi:hypothetical protein